MAGTLTTYDTVLKEVYDAAIRENVNNAAVLLKRVQRDSETFTGREFVIATHGQRNEQVGAAAATATSLPSSANQDNQGFGNATIKPTYQWGVIKLQQSLIDQTKSNEGSFVRAISSEVQRMANDLAVDVNRQLFGDSTGALTACGTTTASTSVTVTSTTQLRTGMGIDVIVSADGTTGTGAAGRYVSSVTSSTVFVISGAAITTDSTYSVYRAGSRNNETNGLANIIKATGALHGLNPATAGQEYWQSYVQTTTGTLSEVKMQKNFDAPAEAQYGTGGQPSLALTDYPSRRAWQNILTGLKRYANTIELEGGFKALDYNGLPIVSDRMATAGVMYWIDEPRLRLFEVPGTPGWMDEDGKVLKWDTGTGYKAVFRWFINLGTDARNAHSAASGITALP